MEERPDGRFVVCFWNADLQRWTYEDPDDRGERGLSLLIWWGILAGLLCLLLYSCTHG